MSKFDKYDKVVLIDDIYDIIMTDFHDNATKYLITNVFENNEGDYLYYLLIIGPKSAARRSGYHEEKELVSADIAKILLANFATKEPLIEKNIDILLELKDCLNKLNEKINEIRNAEDDDFYVGTKFVNNLLAEIDRSLNGPAEKQPKYLSILNITLPSVSDISKLSKDVLNVGKSYWLKDPGGEAIRAKYVTADGNIDEYGDIVYKWHGIRPVLIIRSHNFEVDDIFEAAGYKWRIIRKDNCALCEQVIVSECQFLEYQDPNYYNNSSAKSFIQKWANRQDLLLEINKIQTIKAVL